MIPAVALTEFTDIRGAGSKLEMLEAPSRCVCVNINRRTTHVDTWISGYVDTWIRGYVDTGSTPKGGSFLGRTSRAARDRAGPGRSETLSTAPAGIG